MNIQIFGTKKCNDTKKAERFFKERGIKYQFIDMKEKGMSKGEFNSVAQANGGLQNMINWDGKDKALGLKPVRRKEAEDGSFILVYLGDGKSSFELELTWLRDRTEPYNLGDLEYHLALSTKDMAAAHQKHEEMGCIAFENPAMGIYFITDPDGYWIEVVPE